MPAPLHPNPPFGPPSPSKISNPRPVQKPHFMKTPRNQHEVSWKSTLSASSIYIYNKTTVNPPKARHTSAVANHMEHRRRPKDQMGGRSKPDVVCRKHPKHRQSPGVCSVCLSEKLSQLSTSSRSSSTAPASSSSSSSLSSCSSHYSSSEASSCSSPMQQRFRLASDAKGSFSFLLSGKNMLTKSRSVAFVTRRRAGDGGHANKKSGFWSKLLPPRDKRREDVLMYSRTVRERAGVGATRIH